MSAFQILLAVSSAAGHAVENGAEHASEGVFPPFDSSTYPSQLFWFGLSFGVLLFLLAKVLLPRVGSVMEDRNSKIADDLDAAARMQREAELAEKAFDKALADARAKAHNVAETTRASVAAENETKMAAAEQLATEQMEEAEAKIRAMREKALSNVEDIAVDTAKAMAEKLFGGTISVAAARKAVKAKS
ncbi:MAG TPA: F0F1 ATP synthase subunit B' [Hellea balneolensis]|uniref:ATP synthase subunit b n=1 Tax=Hellea balneolensis TaxID=287478 RepID=A0A7C5R067_9PROT|nr:F0F1 ATP synthase subunit B' [Hellea balneolensis]